MLMYVAMPSGTLLLFLAVKRKMFYWQQNNFLAGSIECGHLFAILYSESEVEFYECKQVRKTDFCSPIKALSFRKVSLSQNCVTIRTYNQRKQQSKAQVWEHNRGRPGSASGFFLLKGISMSLSPLACSV